MSQQVRGFTLVEVLVALVIFAVALLGIAALHIESLNSGRTALNRTQAVTLAADLADRIRANREACNVVDPLSPATCNYEGTGTENTNCESVTGCTPAELAAHDIFRWRARGAQQLPGFTSSVDFVDEDPSSDEGANVYTITVGWIEPGTTADATYSLRIRI